MIPGVGRGRDLPVIEPAEGHVGPEDQVGEGQQVDDAPHRVHAAERHCGRQPAGWQVDLPRPGECTARFFYFPFPPSAPPHLIFLCTYACVQTGWFIWSMQPFVDIEKNVVLFRSLSCSGTFNLMLTNSVPRLYGPTCTERVKNSHVLNVTNYEVHKKCCD